MAPAASVGPSMPSVPTLAATAARAQSSERARRGKRELLVAAALARAGHRDRGLARGNARRRAAAGRATQARDLVHMSRRRNAGLAGDGRVDDEPPRSQAPRPPGAPPRPPRAADQSPARVARARRASSAASASPPRSPAAPARSRAITARRERRLAAAALQHGERVGERALVGNRRTRGDDREVVADDVRHRQRQRPAGARRREQPALDRRQVLADGVQLVDVGAGFQQAPRRSAACRRASRRRPAAPSAPSRRPTAARAGVRRGRTLPAISSARRAPPTLPSVGSGWPPACHSVPGGGAGDPDGPMPSIARGETP